MAPASSLASFSRRLGAGVVDFCILVAFAGVVGSFGAQSKGLAEVTLVLLSCVPLLYQISLHALFGQTVGKRLLSICVRRVDGSPIGGREAFLRSSVDVVFSLHWFLTLAIVIHQLQDDAFINQGWSNLYSSIEPSLPAHFQLVSILGAIWGWSEFVTMLLNEQRRAIHDFIAGTVVLHARSAA